MRLFSKSVNQPNKEYRISLCFLYYDNDENIPTVKCNKYDIKSLQIEYNNKKVPFYEIFLKNDNLNSNQIDISLYINKIEYLIHAVNIRYAKNFLFNYKIFNVKEKKECALNCFNIEDEFNIYYKYCLELKEIHQPPYLNSLFSIRIDLLKSGNDYSSFSFFMKIYMINSNIDWENCIKKINIIGNLKEIDESKINNDKIYILFKILSDIESLETGINDKVKRTLFECLEKYPNLQLLS